MYQHQFTDLNAIAGKNKFYSKFMNACTVTR